MLTIEGKKLPTEVLQSFGKWYLLVIREGYAV